jgi:hypothetical protein
MSDVLGESRRLSESEREQTIKNLAHLERLGDLVGGWGVKSMQCRQGGFTMTMTFDRKVDVFEAQEFVEMMEQSPALLAPILRRLLELNDNLKEATAALKEKS